MRKKYGHVKQVRPDLTGRGRSFGIVVSRFNEPLTERLLEGALDTFLSHGVREKDITVARVPGAFEVPLAAKKLIRVKKFDAVLTLAVIIRGETKHFDQVAAESARALGELSQKSEVPVILGIITAENVAQAEARTGVKGPNKGREWALSALEMAGLLRSLKKKS